MENKVRLIEVYTEKMQKDLEKMVEDGSCENVSCANCVYNGVKNESCVEVKGFYTWELKEEKCKKIFKQHKNYLDKKFFGEKSLKQTNSSFRKMENRVLGAMQEITDISFRMGFTGIRFLTGTELLIKNVFVKGKENETDILKDTKLIDFRNADIIEKYMDLAITIANNLIDKIIKETDNLDKQWTVAFLEDLVHFKRTLLKGKLELQCEPLADLGSEEAPF